MKIFLTFVFLSSLGRAMSTDLNTIWINASSDSHEFQIQLTEGDGTSMASYQLEKLLKTNRDHSYLMSRVEYWAQEKLESKIFEKQLQDINTDTVLSSSNRIVLFEYLKMRVDQDPRSFHSLCRYYANDSYLRTVEPFFESSCHFQRWSFKDLNLDAVQFDYALIDGNKINLKINPYFYSAGSEHQFIFVSSRYKTKELTMTAQKLKQSNISLEPWVDGKCNKATTDTLEISNPVKIFFSKECIQDSGAPSATKQFLVRNRYYIYTGIILTVAAAFLKSQYELGVTLH